VACESAVVQGHGQHSSSAVLTRDPLGAVSGYPAPPFCRLCKRLVAALPC